MREKQVGFFGGTFDPIHWGHVNLALNLKERCGLDEVWICPAFVNPFKADNACASGEDRLEMARLAVQPLEGFKVIDHEVRRGGPSYTIETLRELASSHKVNFRLLLGEDQLASLASWKESELLFSLAPPLVGSRSGFQPQNSPYEVIKTPLFDISATEIRARLLKGLFVGHLLPASVEGYIFNKGLYLNAKK